MTRSLRCALLLLLGGCATYRPAPLPTVDPTARFNARRLDHPGFRSALDSAGMHPAASGWRDWELAEAAWLLRPERARLASEVGVAEAARVTAGGRPNPGVNTETEYSFSGTHGESRWGLALSTVFTVELGGKRGARLGRANAGILAAEARREEEAWEIRWRVHEAAVRLAISDRLTVAIARERDLSDSLLVPLRRRFEDGMIAATEVARAESERAGAAAGVASQVRELADRRAALAAAVGIPLVELNRTPLALVAPMDCGSVPHDSLQRLALGARRSLRRVLAEYLVAEAEVRVEVASSWPDLQLGPGLFFDQGVGKWTIGFGLPSLPLHGNRGPIAEAEARRTVAADRVTEMQEKILNEVEQAAGGCSAASAEARALDLAAVRQQLGLAEAAYARGEAGRLDVGVARLQLARAERRVADLQGAIAEARLALERAVGLWGPESVFAAAKEGQ